MKNITDSIFKIITSSGTGTGFKVQDHDFVITNYHVIQGSKKVTVEDNMKNKHLAHVVMVNPEVDLAFLQVDGLKDVQSQITIDSELEVENISKLYINGYPFGMPFTVTEGIISSVNQPMGSRHYIQTDAAVNPGNSGGPMLNSDLKLVAVTTSKFTDADNVGFGIKSGDVIKEINDFHFDDSVYRVKCNSCDTFIEKETEFCTSCGNDIDKSVFEEFEKSYVANFIESAISQTGIDPVLYRAGRDYWEFHQGTALIRVFTHDDDEHLFITSPLNSLPKSNLEDLLVFINTNQAPPYMMGIYDNKIYLSYRLHLSDIYVESQKEIIKENFINMLAKADELDDYLEATFGCKKSLESKVA
ncbi:MAG: trypsin-like peptidase domain-containing protein [Thiotrichaceae bacterium]|nr:trypsin-like peptidase domain-containing protein [Thiotrichaceae bacterium]